MCLEVGRVDHDGLVIGAFGGQACHDPGEDALFTPAFPAVVESFGQTILPVRAFSRTMYGWPPRGKSVFVDAGMISGSAMYTASGLQHGGCAP